MGKRRRNKHKTKVVDLFVYGTLCTGGKLRPHIEHGVINSRGAVTFGSLCMVQDAWYPGLWEGHEVVVGELLTIRSEMLGVIDQMEQNGTMYKRVLDKVIVEEGIGEEIDAYLYVSLGVPQGEAIKNGDFIEHVKERRG